jgi:pyridoxal phosphate enzyme (YggS family)
MNSIQDNLKQVTSLIQSYESRYARKENSVALLAVSKSQPIEKILEAYYAGQRRFGENYLQEALAKITTLNHEEIEWHFIGPLQSNKLKKIAEHFQWVHSVASLKHAQLLNEQRPTHLPPLNICLQINIGQETSKSGLHPDQIATLASACLALPRLMLRGLMCIPAAKKNLTDQRQEFRKLFDLQLLLIKNGFKLDTLSMGMSNDLEAAIAEGSTMVRIGTKIFGQRR